MKPKVEIKEGDKVFAKVKGYPPWPATVNEIVGKRYLVTFYGTKETSKLKLEDLSDFLENKDKLRIKYCKKKEIIDAIDELDNELGLSKNHSSDTTKGVKIYAHNNKLDNSETESETTRGRSDPISSKRKKRSLSSQSIDDLPKAKRAARRRSSVNSNKSIVSQPHSKADSVEDKSLQSSNSSLKEPTVPLFNQWFIPVTDNIITESDLDRDYKIVWADDIYAKLLDKNHKSSNLHGTKSTEINGKIPSKKFVLMARIPLGRFIGIVCEEESSCNKKNPTEADLIQHNDTVFRNALNLKDRIESGSLLENRIKDEPTILFEPELTTQERLTTIEKSVVKRKQSRLQYLMVESKLVEYDSEIKAYLGLEKADCEKALACLDKLSQLKYETLMLTKHPHVVDMIRRLRRYIGNVKQWQMKEDELNSFMKQAELIRRKAVEIYNQFKVLYDVKDVEFKDVYNEAVAEFNDKTKHLKEGSRFAVCAKPGTKQFEIDQMDDQLELEALKLKTQLEYNKGEHDGPETTAAVED